jgi:hypothetical protein
MTTSWKWFKSILLAAALFASAARADDVGIDMSGLSPGAPGDGGRLHHGHAHWSAQHMLVLCRRSGGDGRTLGHLHPDFLQAGQRHPLGGCGPSAPARGRCGDGGFRLHADAVVSDHVRHHRQPQHREWYAGFGGQHRRSRHPRQSPASGIRGPAREPRLARSRPSSRTARAPERGLI